MTKKGKWMVASVVLILGLLIAGFGCAPATPPTEEVETLNFGVLAPISGPMGVAGVDIARGLELWADDVNSRGGFDIGGVTYMAKAIQYDDGGFLPAESLEAFQRGYQRDGTKFWMSTGVQAINEPIAEWSQANAPDTLYTLWGVSPAISPKYPNIIGTNYWAINAAPYMLYYKEVLGVETMVNMTPDAAFGLDSKTWATVGARAAGIEILAQMNFPLDAPDYRSVMQQAMSYNPDLIFVNAGGALQEVAMEAALYELGYEGLKFETNFDLTAALDKMPESYLEGLGNPNPQFPTPADGEIPYNLYTAYDEKWPGEWADHAQIIGCIIGPFLETAIKGANSIDPEDILAWLSANKNNIDHPVFGKCVMTGEAIWGVDRFLANPYWYAEIRGGVSKVITTLPIDPFLTTYVDTTRDVLMEAGMLEE